MLLRASDIASLKTAGVGYRKNFTYLNNQEKMGWKMLEVNNDRTALRKPEAMGIVYWFNQQKTYCVSTEMF